jgi:capsid portal protein
MKRAKPSAINRARRRGLDLSEVLDNRFLMEALTPKRAGRKLEWGEAKINQLLLDSIELYKRRKEAGKPPYLGVERPILTVIYEQVGASPKRPSKGARDLARDLIEAFPEHYQITNKGQSRPMPAATLAKYIAQGFPQRS